MSDHSHSHKDHSHSHAPKDFGFAFALGTALDLGFVAVEAVFGLIADSTALLADAGHNLIDPPYVPGMDAAGVIDEIGEGTDTECRSATR